MNATKVIGLWLDTTNGNEGWIVSRDEMNSHGETLVSRTVAVYDVDDYADALAFAKDLAQRSELCLIETAADGDNQQECIYQPDGAINPLATA